MAHDLDRLPVYVTDLIESLDRAFPHKCVRPGETIEEAHRYAGKRELVDFLLQLQARGEQSFPQR